VAFSAVTREFAVGDGGRNQANAQQIGTPFESLTRPYVLVCLWRHVRYHQAEYSGSGKSTCHPKCLFSFSC